MNELNKLIQQYETENPGQKAFHERIFVGGSIRVYHEGFVEWLASRPTCTKNERAFLDEIKENGVYETEHEIGHDDHIDIEGVCPAFISIGDESTVLFQSDFTKSNLKELVDG